MASMSAWIKKIFNSKAKSSSATPSATPSAPPSATPSATPSVIVYATTPEQFLELTKACEDRARWMLTPDMDGSMSRLRINDRQCEYLAEKLMLAVQGAEKFLTHLPGSPISEGEKTNCLDQFKLLHNVACAVETFIQNCCGDAWVAAAFLMLSTTQDVLSVIFDLVLLAYFFSGNYVIEVENVYIEEASIVTKKAENDRHLLLRNVKALLLTEEKNNAEYELAELLLKRLETSGAYRTDIKSLTEEDLLGSGGYADVYKSKWLGIVDVAVKTFYGPDSQDFQTEVSIVGGLSHPNLTSMFGYAKNDRECSIVMELMDCDLSKMIRNIMRDESRKLPYPFSMSEAVNIMLQVGKGVEYLHEMRIVHRDLKAANILVKQLVNCGDGESKSILVKVADFGLSKTKENSMTYSTQTFNKGTARWMAPEVIQIRRDNGLEEVFSDPKDLKYPYKSDVHSFGMVCYEILTGKLPYYEVAYPSEVKRKILSGDHPQLPEHCFPELKELIERCWSLDASKRPPFREICAELRTFRFQLLLSDWQQRIYRQVAVKLHGEERIVVGLECGMSTSGYAFARRSKPDDVVTWYDWPESRNSRCKPPMAIYYEPGDGTPRKVKSWGFPAMRNYLEDSEIGNGKRGRYYRVTPFGDGSLRSNVILDTELQVFVDYLQEIGASIMRHLRTKFSDDITLADVEWCVTVPRTENGYVHREEAHMQVCMERAGLVQSANSLQGSPHPPRFVLDAEAASCYSHRIMTDLELKFGDRLLVADMGDENSKIVVQEWMSETPDDFKVKILNINEWCYYGGGAYDVIAFLEKTFPSVLWPQYYDCTEWLKTNCNFNDLVTIGDSFKIQLSSKLAAKWEELDKRDGISPRSSYDELELTHADIEFIFEPCVKMILGHIEYEISRTPNVKVIFVVGEMGGFPYLLTKIKERFLGTVEKVISPMQPGSAASQGAVMLAL